MEPLLLTYHAPVHGLDVVARHVAGEDLASRLAAWKIRTGARELLYASTCQRVLWLLWGGDPAGLGLDATVERLEGESAWRYLLAVAAGLESANLGDREVPAQLLDGLADSRRAGTAGPEAEAALEDVVREAQRLRTRIGLADGTSSVATVALRHLEARLEPGASIALVGVGPMCAYLASRLPERGFRVTVANRTPSRARDLAGPLGLPHLPLAALQKDPRRFQAVVTATSSPDPIFTKDAWGGLSGSPLHLLDLALPPDSEPQLAELPWIHRTDLDAFLAATRTAADQRQEAARAAEEALGGAAGRLRKRAADRHLKRELFEARQRIEDAWLALEEEALAGLEPARRESLTLLLKRGRTLAHRALAQRGEVLVAGLESPRGFGFLRSRPQNGSCTLDAGVPCPP